jgi:tellurite resistance protein
MLKNYLDYLMSVNVDQRVVDGIAAAVAIVACADLHAGLRESWMLRRASKTIDRLGQLPRREILAAYKTKVATIEEEKIAPPAFWQEIEALSNRPDIAKMTGQLCFDVMCADGDMDAFEIKEFIAVCKALGLDAARDFRVV